MQRIRSKKLDHGPNPVNLELIEIPFELKSTYTGEEFLFYDTGVEDLNRILIFTTRLNINYLKANKTWYGDGTFAVSPSIYYQLYTINIIIQGKNLPLVYALLPNKTEEIYDKMYNSVLKEFDIDLNEYPVNVAQDFEKGVLNVINNNLKNVTIFGCYFHFCQNLWKHMQKKHLSIIYIRDKDTRKQYKFLKALCYVPPLMVIQAFKIIRNSAPSSFLPMIDHIEKFFIGKPHRTDKGVRKIPMFPITQWNCYYRVLNGEARTNNSLG